MPNPLVVALLRRYVTSPDEVVVDVGCGPALYRDATPGRYIGVDVVPFPYGSAAGTADLIAPAHRLPFESSSIDVVFTLSALYQFPDPDAALREFHRVLRPGGRVLVVDYNRRALRRLSRTETAPRPRWTAWGLRRRVARAGFDELEVLAPRANLSSGFRRLLELVEEELVGQWAIVTGTRGS